MGWSMLATHCSWTLVCALFAAGGHAKDVFFHTGPGGGQASSLEIDAALSKAQTATSLAWNLTKEVQNLSQANVKFMPLFRAQMEVAKNAAETAKEEDDKVTKLFEETQKKANEAAMKVAEEYFQQVKKAGADAIAAAHSERSKAESDAEVAAATAGQSAAAPYHAQLLRGEKVIVDYNTRAKAYAAASNNLRAAGANLIGNAQIYQTLGQVVPANHMVMTAQSLAAQSRMMKDEADRLHAKALEIHAALPAYQVAEQAAADAAAFGANPNVMPDASLLPY